VIRSPYYTTYCSTGLAPHHSISGVNDDSGGFALGGLEGDLFGERGQAPYLFRSKLAELGSPLNPSAPFIYC